MERRGWIIWGVGVFAYAVAIFQRTSLAVAAGPATERFDIGAATLSSFAVLQLITYAGLQIPVGVLVDQIGSRVMIGFGAAVMACGQLLLAFSTEPVGAVLARILIGCGDAMTFVSVLRLVSSWFPAARIPLLTQLTGQVGQLGQVASTFPLVLLLAHRGWTTAYVVAAGAGLVTAVLVLTFVRNRPAGAPAASTGGSFREARNDLLNAFQHPGTRLGLWSHFTAQFSGMVFALLWGYPFMTVGLGYSRTLAGTLMTIMVLTAAVIGPFLGQLTSSYPMRRSNMIFGVILTTIAGWTAVIVWPGRPPLWLIVVLILILAAYGPASAVGFDFARTFNPAGRIGAATGIVNVGGFVASLVTIYAIGVILDLRSPGPTYSLTDFRVAFCFQYVLWAFGLIAVWRTRRLARAGLRAGGVQIDRLHQAVRRRWRARRDE